MNLLTSIPEREAITAVQYLPTVSIIIPFTPVITLKKDLEYCLKNVMGKVEAMLITHYPAEKAMPVIIKLKNLIGNLNYNTHKKSIAIFVSPVLEKVYYLEVDMEEKIVIDQSFEIRDLVYCKKQKTDYLVVLLSDKFSRMYLGNSSHLILIKSNTLTNAKPYENGVAEKVANFFVDDNQKEIIVDKFLHQMDQGLSIVLKSYLLPVFAMGTQKVLGHFKKITKNEKNIVQFIHGNYEEATEAEISRVMEHFISRWKKLKQQHLLNQVEKAKSQNKLTMGLQEALKAAMQNRGRLLIIEKNYLNPSQKTESYEPFCKIDSSDNNVFFIKDEVDDIIEKVFKSGGDVEFVDDGMLKDYRHLALIENY
jgi:hypothetical protein